MRSTITLAVAAIAVPVLVVVFCHLEARSETPPLCVDAETRETVRGLMMDGITAGLTAQATRLYDIWLKDPSDQPDRAAVGMRNGVQAYVRARRDIGNWTPPACKGGTP